MFNWLKNRAEKRRKANNLYSLAANHARHPDFYLTHQVSDSITGRYELLCLHVYLLLEALRSSGADEELSQMLTEILVKELERAYRDSGFRDLAIPKNIKRLIAGFYERAQAYRAGLKSAQSGELVEALNHYVYTGATAVDNRAESLARYVISAHNELSTLNRPDLENANFAFISPQLHP